MVLPLAEREARREAQFLPLCVGSRDDIGRLAAVAVGGDLLYPPRLFVFSV